jgi:ParB-like chromosome segregation protein Spo0J
MKLSRTAVPLSRLILSPLNTRQTPPDDPEVEGLADSILALGLLQPLLVHKVKRSRNFGAVEGGRRFTALCRLRERTPAVDFDFDAIDVVLAEGTDAELIQASVTANFQREPMTDVQIYAAVRRIMDTGRNLTDEVLAQSFGVTLARMRRILRLAYVHPVILETYEKRGLSEAALYAYAATADQALQKDVYDTLQGWERNDPAHIRRALGVADQSTADMLRVVGVDTYLAAGGAFEADLFSQNAGRVLSPDVLLELYNAHLASIQENLRQTCADRELTFGEPPQDRWGPDHRLRARAVPTVPAEVQEPLDRVRDAVSTLEEELSEAVDWQLCDEQGVDVDVQSPETVWAEIPFIPDLALRAREIVAELTPLRTELAQLEARAAEAPLAIPAAATHVSLTVQDGTVVPTFWYPDAKAAGFSTLAGGAAADVTSTTPAAPADPALPTLTGRADAWLRAARVNMAIAHVLADGEASAFTRSRAHKALLFAMAHRLVSSRQAPRSYWVSHNYGLVHNFDGATYNYAASGVEAPDADLLATLATIPGMGEKDVAAGFLTFEENATPEQIELCAAILFTTRIEGALDVKGSLADEVMTDLAVPVFARRAWAPTRAFFDLFRKATVQAWIGAFEHAFAFGNLKVAELKDGAVAFFTAGPEEQVRYGLTPATAESVRGWVPQWLRWESAGQLAAMRAGKEAQAAGTAAGIVEVPPPAQEEIAEPAAARIEGDVGAVDFATSFDAPQPWSAEADEAADLAEAGAVADL